MLVQQPRPDDKEKNMVGSQSPKKSRRQSLRKHSEKLGLEGAIGESRYFRQLLSASQIILSVAAVGFLLYFTRSIIIPLVMAFLLYSMVIPILDWLEDVARMPRILACFFVFFAVAAIPLLLALPFSSVLTKVIQDAHLYRAKISSLFVRLELWAERIGLDFDDSVWMRAVQDIPFSSYLSGMASWFVDLLIYIGLVILFFLFILASRRSPKYRSALFIEVNRSISKYLALKAFISALTAVSVGLVLYAFGLEFALLIAVLTFFLNFIPNIGSIVATLLPLPMALLDYKGIEWFLGVLILPACIQMFFGNIVEPKLQGDSLRLHPITILIALMVWGLVWGPAGMFVAVPITTVGKVFIDRSPRMRWLGRIMEGQLAAIWSEDEAKKTAINSHSDFNDQSSPV